MLKLKIIVILIALPLAGLAVYACWAHQQHARAVAIKNGGARLFDPNAAAQVQQFKDR